jgi:Protein kinase domain
MARVTYPSGDTTASRVKALALWLETHRDRAAAEALVREIKIDPEYLADETRPLAIAAWCRALALFAERYGKETLRETWTGVIHTENLGVWTRVLRGAGGPEGALARLDALGGDEAKTLRWETASSAPGRWHGRVTISHDPAYERDGLWTLARAAELIGVPAMFGMGPGSVELPSAAKVSQATARTGVIVEDYVLSWKIQTARRYVFVGLGTAAAATVPAVSHGLVGAGAALGAGVVTGAITAAWQAGQQRKAESHAQMTRIRALERGVTLKEQREKAAVGFFEGSVVAGKYRLGRKLGAGASGVIHQATRLSDNAPVAIKLLRAAVAHDMVASDRLRREAEALGLTWHPNVVEVFEHDHLADGTAYLVMEQLDGESLATRLRREGRLTPAATLPVATQVSDALGAVHAAGVIHRDVKPSNIFIVQADAGQSEQVKLIDFGIARVEWAETRLTNMGSPLGTPGYMSPEQEHGEEIDARSDLFALGAVIYECLVGHPPPTAVSGSYSIAPGVQPALPPSLPAPAPSIPAAWLKVISRAMAPLPQERYADARAMRDALVRLAQAEPSDAADTPAEPLESGGTRSDTDVKKTNVSK